MLLSALHFSVWHVVLCRYATIYTMFPVFSLVLDQDVKPEMALLYPELYKDLTKVPSKVLLSAFSPQSGHIVQKDTFIEDVFSFSGPLVIIQDFPHLGFDQCVSR